MAENESAGTSLAAGGDTDNSEAASQGTQGQSGSPDVPEWVARLDGLDEKVRGKLSRFKSEKDLAKSYLDLETKLGRSVTVPGENASDEERRAFYKRLGRPEKQDEYELDEVYFPDGVTKLGGEESFRKIAFEVGLTKEQASRLYKHATTTALDGLNQARKQLDAKRKEARELLRKDYGPEYDRNIALLAKVRKTFGDDGFDGFLNEGAGNDPRMIRFMVNVAKKMSEDTLEQGRLPSGTGEQRVEGRLDYGDRRPELRTTFISRS